MDFLSLPMMDELLRCASTLYEYRWAERNGGNLSMLLPELPEDLPVLGSFMLDFSAPALTGRCIAITGSGKYLKNVERDPESNLCVLRIRDGYAELLWGLKNGGRPSSELAAHLMSHEARLLSDPEHRVVLHTHTTELVAMTLVHSLEPRLFTKTLWSMCTECLMFLPDGVAVLPWMPCGTNEIGLATADKMREHRLVVWAHHGTFGAGSSPDEALGLIEIANKAAELYLKTAHLPILQCIGDNKLRELANALDIALRDDYLN